MRNAVVDRLEELAAADERICVITADLGYSVFEKFNERYPNRFFNVGISEQLMASAAAGMALCGKIVITYSIGNFATLRCMEQIRNDICYHNANVKIIAVGGGVSYGQLGMSHHATEDIAMMRALPNMTVLVPADPEEAKTAIEYAVQMDGPCYIRLARKGEPILYQKRKDYDITEIQAVKEGRDAALLLCGPILSNGMDAAERLMSRGGSVGVYSIPCVKPLNRAQVCALGKHYPLIVTVEEHQTNGGLGDAVTGCISAMHSNHAAVIRMGFPDTYPEIVGSREYLCRQFGIDGESIAEKIIDWLNGID